MAITAVGVCCPLGHSADELWHDVARGADGFGPVERFPLGALQGAVASHFDAAELDRCRALAGEDDPAMAFALLAARQALGDRDGTALVVATSAGTADTHDRYDRIRQTDLVSARAMLPRAFGSFAAHLAGRLGLHGPRTTVSTSCASGGHALGVGADLLRAGLVRRVLVVGADAVHPSLFAGFHAAGALAPGPCAPFGQVFGMALGEGAAAVLLECEPPDPPLGYLLGWGGSADGYHPTAPDPQGDGMARSMLAALAHAGLRPDEVGYDNAHGTGTEANDAAETLAIRRVLGERVPVSSTKSQLGHTQGAAGVLEAVVTLMALRHQAVPPTLRSAPGRRLSPADTVPEGRARPHDFDVALSHNAAFGGTNVTVVLGRGRAGRRGGAEVYADGTGAIGPFGEALLDALERGYTAQSPALEGSRRLDRISASLVAAMTGALGDARRARTGTVVAMGDGPQDSMRRFVDSRDERGLDRSSAGAFARMVQNAPAGAACTALQLLGPSVTLWAGTGTGGVAVLVGAAMLGDHDDVDAVVVAGADEIGRITEDRRRLGVLPGRPIEAAAALVLRRGQGVARLAGAAWGGPDDGTQVMRQALGGVVPDRIVAAGERGVEGAVWLDEVLGHAPGAGGVLATVVAIEWIRTGRAGSVLVVGEAADTGTTAALWQAPSSSDLPRGMASSQPWL